MLTDPQTVCCGASHEGCQIDSSHRCLIVSSPVVVKLNVSTPSSRLDDSAYHTCRLLHCCSASHLRNCVSKGVRCLDWAAVDHDMRGDCKLHICCLDNIADPNPELFAMFSVLGLVGLLHATLEEEGSVKLHRFGCHRSKSGMLSAHNPCS